QPSDIKIYRTDVTRNWNSTAYPKKIFLFAKACSNVIICRPWKASSTAVTSGFYIVFSRRTRAIPQARRRAALGGKPLDTADVGQTVRDVLPKMEIEDTDFGFMLAAKRAAANGKTYLRVTQWCLPHHTFICNPPGETLLWDAWVPIDDYNTWVYRISYNPWRPINEKEIFEFKNAGMMPMSVQNIEGSYRPLRNRRNDYLIDRIVQREFSYSGIQGNNAQDAAIIENQGPTPIYDRTQETLGVTDVGITRARRRLLAEAEAVRAGKVPPLATDGNLYNVRPIALYVDDDGTPFHQIPEVRSYIFP
ncbi:MAG: hypothetical protein ACKVQK_02350, partial [Burkholderiales bacterium]